MTHHPITSTERLSVRGSSSHTEGKGLFSNPRGNSLWLLEVADRWTGNSGAPVQLEMGRWSESYGSGWWSAARFGARRAMLFARQTRKNRVGCLGWKSTGGGFVDRLCRFFGRAPVGQVSEDVNGHRQMSFQSLGIRSRWLQEGRGSQRKKPTSLFQLKVMCRCL